ncbi:MAG: UbiD family decarboxylase, partial [Pseudolabrys sp.]
SVMKKVAFEPMFLTHLRSTIGIRGLKGLRMHEPFTNLRKVIFLQFARGTARTEVWRGLQGASSLRADCGKICIAVSEDIDPANADAIFWSLAYRSDPGIDVKIMPYRSAGHGPKSGKREDSTILIDATLKGDMPPLALPRREFMERALTLWKELDLPPITPQAPWHGYTLGDWDEHYDIYARRAVEGKWAESGSETVKRRRGGLIPETPARDIETTKKKS